MSHDQTISNQNKKVKSSSFLLGRLQKEFGAVNQYKDSQIVRDLLDFYRVPLIKAVTRLNKTHKDSFETIAKEVFDNQITRQAVQQNYTEGK